MAKIRQSTETAKTLVSPLFAWTHAMLKGGEMMLDSMEAAAKNARTVRVAVLPNGEMPRRRRTARKANGRSRRAKSRRR